MKRILAIGGLITAMAATAAPVASAAVLAGADECGGSGAFGFVLRYFC